MHDAFLFHVQEKQNLSTRKEGDGCRNEGERQGGVTVPEEPELGKHEMYIDMNLTAQCPLSEHVYVHAKHKGDGMWVARKVIAEKYL